MTVMTVGWRVPVRPIQVMAPVADADIGLGIVMVFPAAMVPISGRRCLTPGTAKMAL